MIQLQSKAILLITFVIGCIHFNSSAPLQNEIVFIKPYTEIKYFHVPTSEEPAFSWMEVQKGLFPNTSLIDSNLTVGEPITLYIYFIDNSFLYDLNVTDCWAYDNANIKNAANKLHLTPAGLDPSQKLVSKVVLSEWKRQIYPKGAKLKSILHASLNSFKFPDKEQIQIKCDVHLCFKTCNRKK